MAAFADDEVQAVLPVRGGYGTIRILESLDYLPLQRHPKLFVGFSDITALHIALSSRLGLVTFHGPHPADGIGAPDGWSLLSEESFWSAVHGESTFPAAGRSLLPQSFDSSQLIPITPGVAEGRLIGGNLATICALLGTPFEIQTTGCVLFLEDVDEPPYRIDRMLAQLKLAGKLAAASGILLGQFTNCEPVAGKPSLSLQEVLSQYFDKMPIPVLSNFPAGHARDNVTLPLSVPVRLDATARRVTQLEPACLCV
jgi:muramoyltetrapeptide carboxypeptidase